MVGCILNPTYDCIFLVTFDTCQAADAATFGYQRQRFDDFVFRCVSPIKNSSFGFCKGSTTGLAPETLTPCVGLPKLNDILLMLALQLSMICTRHIWAEIAYLGKL